MGGSSPKVLLLSAPWQTPNLSNIGMSTLRAILLRAGIETDELHGTLMFPFKKSSMVLRLQVAAFFFVPYLHPEVSIEACIDAALGIYIDGFSLQGLHEPNAAASFAALGLDATSVRQAIRDDIERAGVCIERCVEAAEGYDVVGFSCTFEPQLPGALAIAKRIKARWPHVRIIMGGSACFGEPGTQILKWTSAVDAVCHCEGDDVIVPLIHALRAGGSLEGVPGIVWREGGTVRKTPAPPLLTDMDALPIPDYTPFVWQLRSSPWGGRNKPQLQFELSRGCWWGEKHICTFCGLNAEGITYRKKSPERAYQEIVTLYERYPTAGLLYASDNILDPSYLKTVFPRLVPLARRPRPLRLFFEIKASLKRDEVRVLRAGGVTGVQPGIESFSDQVLKVMDKGAIGLGQLQNLKWLSEEGIDIVYNFLIGNPGEEAAAYHDMCELVPYIEHLPPPLVTAIYLERFSPYFESAERYGLTRIRAKPYYRTLCQEPEVDIERLAYVFDYDHPMWEDRPLRDAQRKLASLVERWVQSWRVDTFFYRDAGSYVEVLDRRDGGSSNAVVSGAALELFRYLDRVRTWDALERRFADWPAPLLQGLLDTWRRRRWLCRDAKGRHLSVIPLKATVVDTSVELESATA